MRSFITGAFAPSMSPWNNRDPIRAELFSVERLEEHARSLAAAQPVTPKAAKGNPLAGRLVDNEAVLLHAYRTIAKAISEEQRDHPGGRMADRQLPSRREADPRNPLRSAAGLLPPAAQAC